MDDKYEESMRQLFCARWNIPQAARNCAVTDDECKELFRLYCKDNPVTHVYDSSNTALLDCSHE